jgi:purine-binding chemotaxis protein CheW
VTEICPNCGHSSGYFRSTSEDWRCRRCGYIWGAEGTQKPDGGELTDDARTDGEPTEAAPQVAATQQPEATPRVAATQQPEAAPRVAGAQERALQEVAEFSTPSVASVSSGENYGFFAADVARILHERAVGLAQGATEVSEIKTLLLVLFAIQDEWYAIDVRSVREIRREYAVTPVPGAPPYIRGVINLRGEIVSVTDLASLLGLASASEEDASTMIVCDLEGRSTGILVGALADIVEVPEESIEPPLGTLERARAEHIRGQVAVDDRLVTVLDLERAITPIG